MARTVSRNGVDPNTFNNFLFTLGKAKVHAVQRAADAKGRCLVGIPVEGNGIQCKAILYLTGVKPGIGKFLVDTIVFGNSPHKVIDNCCDGWFASQAVI